MATRFTLAAEPRKDAGKGASRRLRHSGRIPGILYGGGQPSVAVTLDSKQVLHNAAQEAFLSSILDIDLGGEHLQAIVKDIQVHPARRAVMHLDLQRVLATEKIRMTVPLHFLNEAASKGVKDGGGIVSHLVTEVEISCLPKDLPEFLQLDLIDVELNGILHLSDIRLPEGVEISDLAAGSENDRPVVSIHLVKEVVEEAAEAAAGEAAAAPAAEAKAAAPAGKEAAKEPAKGKEPPKGKK